MNKIINNLIGCGEEFISQIMFDALKNEVHITIKNIIRYVSDNFETESDKEIVIEEGVLVLTGVKKIFFDSNGVLPNDLEKIEVGAIQNGLFEIKFYAFDQDEKTFQYIPSTFRIVAKDCYLIDTKNPSVKMKE